MEPSSRPGPTEPGEGNEPNAGGEERRRAVCERTARTVRCGGGRSLVLSRQCRASAGASRRPYSTRQVVLLLAQEGGRLVTSLDVTVEDRPLGNPVRRVAGLPSAAPYVVRQAQ